MNKYLNSQRRELNPQHKELVPSTGDRSVTRAFAQPASIDETNRRIRFVCSTNAIDRFGEIVEPAAFRKALDRFEANPVLLAGHVHVAPDGSPTSIGHWLNLKINQHRLEGIAQFMDGDDLAERYWQRYRQGVQRAVSVGFIVHAWEFRDVQIGGEKQRVRVFTEIELIEISAVSVPANHEAVAKDDQMHVNTKGTRLGERIRARREEMEMTQEDLGNRIGRDATTIADIESGEIVRPPDEVLRALAEALDLSFEELQRLADRDQDTGAGGDDHKSIEQIIQVAVEQAIAKHLPAAVQQQLNADPGTPLHLLLSETAEHAAEQALGAVGHGHQSGGAPGSKEAGGSKESGASGGGASGGHPAVDYLTGGR